MVQNSIKTYGELLLEAQTKTDRQEVGETLEPILKQLQNIIEEIVQLQAESAMKGGFYLPKYYIHIFIVKDPLGANGMEAPNTLRIRKPHCRVTRPSPYQEEDHFLWSVTNLNDVKFEWCIPSKEIVQYVLSNPGKFHRDYVVMLRKYCEDKIDKIEDYMINGKVT